eukprot:197592-Prorocentrum_minimum.AAC.2
MGCRCESFAPSCGFLALHLCIQRRIICNVNLALVSSSQPERGVPYGCGCCRMHVALTERSWGPFRGAAVRPTCT